ncbi:MAG: PTS lactose/cellobiose transporter subunit IIA [Eubacteriales bacterium]|nr:PTS lactose/cellobiose transporter subunit IIA [Eubacteriales bacterium]
MNEQIVNIAMQILLHAGDARTQIAKAGNLTAEFKIEKAEEMLKKAQENLLLAHKTQTSLIQGEADGEKVEISVLFSHAQDTLMVTGSEYNMAKQMLNLTKSLLRRLEGLESR